MIWTEALTLRLKELIVDPEEYSEREMANILSKEFGLQITRDQLHNKKYGLSLTDFLGKERAVIMPYYNKYRDIYESPATTRRMLVQNNDSEYISVQENSTVLNLPYPELKIVSMNDFHVPFESEENIQLVLNRCASFDIAVVSEVMDCYSISKFNKSKNIPLEVEIDRTIRILETLSESFPLVIMLVTNHDARVGKQMNKIPESLKMLTQPEMLSFIAKPFNNIVVIPQWYFQINDAIFCHFERTSVVEMKSAISAYNFFSQWQGVLELNPFRFIAQAHTHQMGVAYEKAAEVKIVETGTLCKVMDYAVKTGCSRPQISGYVEVIQRDGETKLDLSREHILPPQVFDPNYVSWV